MKVGIGGINVLKLVSFIDDYQLLIYLKMLNSLFLITIWVYYFFRDPDRVVINDNSFLVSPADGLVTDISELKGPVELSLENETFTRISIFMNVFNCHVNRIPTAGKGFWGAIWMWLTGVRTWEVADDWAFKIGSTWYVIPQGFVFDGASIPKFLHTWLSPTGVLLMGGLVHDYAYKYATLLKSGKKKTMGTIGVPFLF